MLPVFLIQSGRMFAMIRVATGPKIDLPFPNTVTAEWRNGVLSQVSDKINCFSSAHMQLYKKNNLTGKRILQL